MKWGSCAPLSLYLTTPFLFLLISVCLPGILVSFSLPALLSLPSLPVSPSLYMNMTKFHPVQKM